MGSPAPADGPSTPSPKAHKAISLAELVSSFGMQQSPTSITYARRSVENKSLSPLKSQHSPKKLFPLVPVPEDENPAADANNAVASMSGSTRLPATFPIDSFSASLDAPSVRSLDQRKDNCSSTNGNKGRVPTNDVSGTAQPLGQDIVVLSNNDDDDASTKPKPKTPTTTSNNYSSPIYLVSTDRETDADDSTLAGDVATPIHLADETDFDESTGDGHVKRESTVLTAEAPPPINIRDDEETPDEPNPTEVQEPPCTPARNARASPSTQSRLLSFMGGEDAASDDSGTPDSRALRRSGRTKNTPKTYSLKKLTNPGSATTKKTTTLRLESDLAASPTPSPLKRMTARKQVRDEIAKITKVKRDRFLAHHKDLFLPLLPDQNYIAHLENQGGIVEYVDLPEQPAGITATLKPHQLAGLSFLVHMHKNGMPCILGDEMGLGKTLQTLSLFQWIEEHQSTAAENRPYLVVCPLSVLSSWVAEAKKWTPDLSVLSLHGAKAERQYLKKVATGAKQKHETGEKTEYKIIVTTYEIFKAEQGWFKTAFVWRYVVLDEGHTIKNSKTQVAKDFQGISPEYRLVLSGTLLQNDLAELWSIFHWLLPEVFTSKTSELFTKSFNLGKGSVDLSVMDRSRRLLELLMLRRLKSSPGIDLGLPPKSEVLLYVPLTPMQRALYMRLITHQGDLFLHEVFAGTKVKGQPDDAPDIEPASSTPITSGTEEAEATITQDRNDFRRLMNLVLQLRKCCNHPYQLPRVQPDPYEIGPHVTQSSGKFIVLEKLLHELILVRKKKVLIFSGFTGMLDLTEDLIALMDAFRHLRIDGSCARAKRNLVMRLFNDHDSDYSAMLISTRAGSLGITLTAATEVIFLDSDWNPQVTLQAEARAHRIGQKNPVTIYKLCTQGTVEEQMIGRIEKKLYLSTKITESMKSLYKAEECSASTSDAPNMNTTQLKSLLRRGAQALTTPTIDVADMVSWDFDQVLAKCIPVDPRMADEGELDEESWLSTMEKVETAIFDGRRIEKEKNKWTDTPVQDLDRTQRRTGKNITVDVDGFAVSKESLECGDWEAVPTMAGKDPTLASSKREGRQTIKHQSYCQVCWYEGTTVECTLCPRSYHRDCLDGDFENSSTAFKGQYFCLQHRCLHCNSKTREKGGLLYRCRFCASAFCEDCVNFELVDLLDFSLPEFEVLGYGANDSAFFIKCQSCKDLQFTCPDLKAYSEKQMKKWETTWDDFKKRLRPSRVLERKDSMNPLSFSSSQPDLETRPGSASLNHAEPSTPWPSKSPCPSPTKRNASPFDQYPPRSTAESPGSCPSPTKRLKYDV